LRFLTELAVFLGNRYEL